MDMVSAKSRLWMPINTLRSRQNRRHFADDIFKCIFLNENVWIPIKISLKFVPQGPINNIPALVQIMAWRRPGDKPFCGPMIVRLPTHICVTRPQWVNAHTTDCRASWAKIIQGCLQSWYILSLCPTSMIYCQSQWDSACLAIEGNLHWGSCM